MRRASSTITTIAVMAAIVMTCLPGSAQLKSRFKHIEKATVDTIVEPESLIPPLDSAMLVVREIDEIISSLGAPDFEPVPVNKILSPWVFSGYADIRMPGFTFSPLEGIRTMPVLTNDSTANDSTEVVDEDIFVAAETEMPTDSIAAVVTDSIAEVIETTPKDIDILDKDMMPRWLRNTIMAYRLQDDFIYRNMVKDHKLIKYAYWDLPERPKLPEDEVTFAAYIRKLALPEVDTEKAELPEEDLRKIHWLHTVNGSAQFSQAYVSSNWYQGGNNHLALLLGFNWNVQLNQVYHPNLLFQSNLSYKLGLNSTPQDEVHDYSISEDLLQYNLNAGLKAWQKWFYSLNLTFKTQMLNNYEPNSMTRKASFMSPGELNIGLGMSYSTQNKPKTFQLTATVSPISYNLKTVISDKVDHERFNVPVNKKTHSEVGSNGEINMNWNIAWNINYKSRLFLFTDYDYFLGDWEHTLSFNVNKFLSTQIYAHLRYDSSAPSISSWKKFQLREVLSFGLSYTFSTKR